MFNANPSRTGGYEAMKALLRSQPELKAAVSYNDVVAFGALSALGEKDLRAGTDFALMGFDNIMDTAHSNPPLSTHGPTHPAAAPDGLAIRPFHHPLLQPQGTAP